MNHYMIFLEINIQSINFNRGNNHFHKVHKYYFYKVYNLPNQDTIQGFTFPNLKLNQCKDLHEFNHNY